MSDNNNIPASQPSSTPDINHSPAQPALDRNDSQTDFAATQQPTSSAQTAYSYEQAGPAQADQPHTQPYTQPYAQQATPTGDQSAPMYTQPATSAYGQYAQQPNPGYAYPPQGAAGQQYPPQGAYYYPQPMPSERWNALCIAGFVLAFILPPLGLILSIIALVQINKSHEKSKAMSIVGIVLGALGTVVIIAIIALIAWGIGYAIDHYDDYESSTGGYPAWCELGLDNGLECQGYEGNGNNHRQYDDDFDLSDLQGMVDQYATSLAAAK